MRIQKEMVMVAWAFIIAAAMTGIAAADPQSVEPVSGYNYDIPTDGTPVTVTLKIGGYFPDWTAGQIHTIKAIMAWAPPGHIGDLRYRFTNETGDEQSGWLKSGELFDWTDNSDPDYVTLEIKAVGNPPTGINYDIRVDDEWTSPAGGVDFGACTIQGESIPEFATIAIPVASILGLLFYFNHRKHRKE
jgi:hypothetical protein